MIKVISWNIGTGQEPWEQLLGMNADVALLQEAKPPPDKVDRLLDIGPQRSWDSHSWNSDWWRGNISALYDRWPMVVRLSDRVEVEWFKQVGPTAWTQSNEIAVSGIGTITAARVSATDRSIEPFIAVSMYGRRLISHPSTNRDQGYWDASVHRIISDISAFIAHISPGRHRILAAGDLNIFYGRGGSENKYWVARDKTVFDRMDTIGLALVGPLGRQAHNSPDELASQSPEELDPRRRVATYYGIGQTPATASFQDDYVFASKGFSDTVSVRALNSPDEWGPSDHCRLEILVS